MATNSSGGAAGQQPRPAAKAEEKYIKNITKALSDGDAGRLTLIIGAGVTMGAIKCGRTPLGDADRLERVKGLRWKGLLLAGLNFLQDGDFINRASESEQKEHAFYKEILESPTIEPSVSTVLRAASFLKGQLVDRKKLSIWLKDEFGTLYDECIGTDNENAMLDAIRDLYHAKARIITTNYDDLLSRHCAAPIVLTDKPDSLAAFFAKADPGRPILHIHGIWREAQGAVLDGVDYFKLNQESFVVDSLRTCLRTNEVVVFVGTGGGLDDPTFGRLLEWADQALSGGTSQYILGPDGYQTASEYLNVIHYGADYDALPSFLRSLVPTGNQNKFHVPFNLSGFPVIGNFCGREADLAKMRGHLQPISDAVQQKVLVLHGLGGIGKTQLALQYAKLCKDEYTAVFWLKGTDEQMLDLNLASLAERIPLPNVLDASGQVANSREAVEKAKAAVLHWLALKGNFRWLIVFDDVDTQATDLVPEDVNADNEEGARNTSLDIRPYFEPLSQGSIIITTRLNYIVQLGIGMEVMKMSTEDSIRILRRTCQRDAADEDYHAVADLLDGLPLALNAAGCFVSTMSISLAGYLNFYRDDSKRLLQHKPQLSKYDATVMTTWERSLAAAEQQRPMISDFLKLCAYFDHSDLCFSILNFAAKELPAWLKALCSNEQSITELIGILGNLAFLQPNAGSDGYSIHPVVGEWLRQRLTLIEWASALSTATTVIGLSRPMESVASHWAIERRLLPHVERCMWFVEGTTEPLSIQPFIYTEIGVLFYNQGRMQEAELLYETAALHLADTPGNPVDEICLLGNLALLKEQQGKFAEAENSYLRLHSLFTTPGLGRLNNMLNLAENYASWGRTNDARDWYTKIIAEYQNSPQANCQHVFGSAMNGMGNVYVKERNYNEAERFYDAALAERERRLGPNNVRTLAVVQGLSIVYDFQGKLDEAEAAYTRCLQGFEAAYGPTNLKTLRAAGNKARFLHMHRQQYAEAGILYKRAIAGVTAAFGADHSEVQGLQHNYTICRRCQGIVQT